MPGWASSGGSPTSTATRCDPHRPDETPAVDRPPAVTGAEAATGPLWTPSPERVTESNLEQFRGWLHDRRDVDLPDFESLHRWSVEHSGEFWAAVWDWCRVRGDRGERLVERPDADQCPDPGERMRRTRFLPDARLNVAENLLGPPSQDTAIVFRGEDGETAELTRAELHDMTGRVQQLLIDAGVGPGDRVAAWMPNRPETYAVMLAAGRARRGVQLHVARLRDGRGARPVQPDRSDRAVRLRRLPLRRSSPRLHRAPARHLGRPAVAEPHRDGGARLARRLRRRVRVRAPRRRCSGSCRSTIPGTCCTPREPPARPSASCTGPAACWSSTWPSIGCTATCGPATGCSTSPPPAG